MAKKKSKFWKILGLFAFCAAAAAIMYAVAHIEWKQEKRGNGYIVCLDAGHGGEDPGAIAYGYEEADDTLSMTLRIAAYLEKQGCTVILTRKDDTYLSLSERSAIANRAGAQAMVSIHRNMQDADASVNGAESWVHSAQPGNAMLLSSCILKRLGDTHTLDVSRGVRSGTAGDAGSNYQINIEAVMASCILELGFISNEEDNRMYHRKENRIAKAIANGILDYLEQDETLQKDS